MPEMKSEIESNLKQTVLLTRVSRAEAERVKKRADDLGISISDYLRVIIKKNEAIALTTIPIAENLP